MNIETWTDPHGLKAEYEQYQKDTWDQQRACMNYPEWLEYRFDALMQASDALIDEKEDEIYQMRNLLLWAQNVINDRGFLTSDQQRLVNEIKDVLTAPDDAPIDLTDADGKPIATEWKSLGTCAWCGKSPDDCRCFAGSEE